jgi:hypothetical protein
VAIPGADDFQYVDPDGGLVTEHDRESYDRRMQSNVAAAIKQMDALFGATRWGVLETGKLFYDVINAFDEVSAIIAKPNVALFDFRMLNEKLTIAGIQKSITQAMRAFTARIPILVLCADPEIDVMWKRFSRMIPYIPLYSACHTDAERNRLVRFDELQPDIYIAPAFQASDHAMTVAQEPALF